MVNEPGCPGRKNLGSTSTLTQCIQQAQIDGCLYSSPARRIGPPPWPPSLHVQARYLRELNQSGNHEAVVQLFESGRLVQPEAALGEYVTALARANRLDNSRLLQTLQVGENAACRCRRRAGPRREKHMGGVCRA
jgi:hypothetical protein